MVEKALLFFAQEEAVKKQKIIQKTKLGKKLMMQSKNPKALRASIILQNALALQKMKIRAYPRIHNLILKSKMQKIHLRTKSIRTLQKIQAMLHLTKMQKKKNNSNMFHTKISKLPTYQKQKMKTRSCPKFSILLHLIFTMSTENEEVFHCDP